ncbi:MAG: hypothetical protein M3N43_00840 [Actinomycetota bacterium]|nr:hypothetical protein [Actinomycetota bacterium]
MREKLISRLEDIPGVASVSLDLDDVESGIRVKLDDEADEVEVLERVRELLVAYGVRSHDHPTLQIGQSRFGRVGTDIGVAVEVTPIKGGARVEVIGPAVRSFRVVAPTPAAIAQGISDAWCQVLGKIPLEITMVSMEGGDLRVVATDGESERFGLSDLGYGWTYALALAVGKAIGVLDAESGGRMRN